MVHQCSIIPEPDTFKLGDIKDEPDQHDFNHDPLMRYELMR